MRSTLTLFTVLASAAIVSSETNCNPSYNVASSGECFTNCNIKAGAKFLPNGFTMDPTSPYFLDSLQLMCTKGTTQYTAFMTQGGMCMAGCKDDPQLFVEEFADACTWYAEHKNDECASDSSDSSADTATETSSSTEASTTTEVSTTTEAATGTDSSETTTSAAATTDESTTTNDADSNLVAEASAANKLQLSGYALALVAGAAYFAL